MPKQRLFRRGKRSRGQSMVEFALLLPVLLLILLVAIDFGRVYLGWINLQQMTRLAANEAADHASDWVPPINTAERDRYRQKVANDARAINCDPPSPIPDPVFSGGTALGAHVQVALTCEFSIITPIISNVLGGTILVSAQTTYPIKEGVVATVPGGGAPIVPPPTAKFVGTPQSGWGPLTVQFVDLSTGGPTSWTWDFSAGSGGTGSGSVSQGTSLAKGPHTVTYSCNGVPGDTCTFGVSLQVSNSGGSDSEVKSGYITVIVPPTSGPIAEFSGSPRTGIAPLTVNFQFDDVRQGAVTYTKYEWDFTGDGTWDATGATSSHSYPAEGVYDVALRVTASDGTTSTLKKAGYIVVNRKICTVPDFANVTRNQAQTRWTNAGFTTQVQFQTGNWNKIHYQSIVGGTIDPQPGGCASVITVGP